jgi:serralysin
MTTSIGWGPIFPVNSTIKSSQYEPEIHTLKDGSFVTVWVDDSRTGADTDQSAIRGQIFNADGSRKGGEFLINTTTSSYQYSPDVVVLNDGRFVVAWRGQGYVWARAYDASGTAIGNDFKAISTSSKNFGITALTNGGFAVSNGDLHEIRVQSFDANLQASGAEATIVTRGGDTEIVGLQDRYMVIDRTYEKIFGTIRNNDGSAPTGASTFDISTTGGDNYAPTATKLADGRVIVVWTSGPATQSDPNLYQIKGQILNANGTKSGGELLLSAPAWPVRSPLPLRLWPMAGSPWATWTSLWAGIPPMFTYPPSTAAVFASPPIPSLVAPIRMTRMD